MLNDTYFKIIKQTITSSDASSSWTMLTACHVKAHLTCGQICRCSLVFMAIRFADAAGCQPGCHLQARVHSQLSPDVEWQNSPT